ncbi:MAG: sulfotransferase [Cyanobacteria bacterium J06560_5]
MKRPVFIVGSPRSGTTFLGKCVAELPEISYHFEPVATKAAARYVHSQEWSFERAKRFYYWVYAWLMRLHADGDLRFAEKTPRNCFLINFLFRAFPDAQFIHIIRDGRDAALSHSKKPWLQAASIHSTSRESSGYRHGPYPRFWVEPERTHEFEATTDIHRCIWAWRCHVSAILEQAQQLPASQYYELRYEHLVAQPKKAAQQLLDYLGIEETDSRSKLYQAFATAHQSSVGGWRQALSSQQVQQIHREAGDLLTRLGYAD